MPHAANHLWCPPRGLDDLALLRRALRDDLRRRGGGRPDRQRVAAAPARGRHDGIWDLRLLPDAEAAGRSRRRREPRVLGPHVSNDVRRAGGVCAGVPFLARCRAPNSNSQLPRREVSNNVLWELVVESWELTAPSPIGEN